MGSELATVTQMKNKEKGDFFLQSFVLITFNPNLRQCWCWFNRKSSAVVRKQLQSPQVNYEIIYEKFFPFFPYLRIRTQVFGREISLAELLH